jgi:hypothetical protein
MKWVVAATAPEQLAAEMWRELLVNAQVPARLQSGDINSFLGVSAHPCRVLVPDHMETQARALLEEYLGRDAGMGEEGSDS